MENNPVRYTDPTGHMVKSDADGAGCSSQGPKCIIDMYYAAGDDDGMGDSLRHYIIRHPDYSPDSDPDLIEEEKFIVSTAMFHIALEYGNSEDITEAGGLLSFFGIIVGGVNYSPDDHGSGSFGNHHSDKKWRNQMANRGWTMDQIYEAIEFGNRVSVKNAVNPENSATMYYHPTTGRTVVIDDVTGEILHIGGDNYDYSDWIIK